MSRNIVPRVNKGADLGTAEKNWNRLFVDAVMLRGENLRSLLDGKTDLNTLIAKGDIYVATDTGVVTRLPAGEDGYVLKSNQADPKGLMWGPAGARQELTGDITINVGIGGDFPTINAALEHVVALYYPKYISGGNCPRVTINLLPGFVMNEQVLVESLDLSWITITGEDDETIINRSALVQNYGGGYFIESYPAFAALNGGFLPIIGQLFNMNTLGDGSKRHGVLAVRNSNAIILRNCGVKNAGSRGITASYNSIINASNAIASGAGTSGIYAGTGSIINAAEANVSGSGSYGIYAWCSGIINAFSVDASDAGTYGFTIQLGSIINARNAIGTLSQAANTVTRDGIIFHKEVSE